MTWRRFVAVCAALTAALSLAQVPVAAAWAPAENATFNKPPPWGDRVEKDRIVQKVQDAISHTPRGSEIIIASYLFDKRRMVDSMIAACNRGVSVRVVLDGHIDSGPSRKLVRALNSDNVEPDGEGGFTAPRRGPCNSPLPVTAKRHDRPLSRAETLASVDDPATEPTWGTDRSYVKQCHRSCRGTGPSMHSKFYAFTRTGTANNVVMVSSSNLNTGGANKGWNDMYTMRGRPKSLAMYDQILRLMTLDKRATNTDRFEVVDGPYTSRFFPWPDGSPDPVMQDLDQIRCHGPLGRTRVNISMFWWGQARGMRIADKVLGLANAGCKVAIIYGAPSRTVAQKLKAAARADRITLYDSRWWDLDEAQDPALDVRTHSKYVLVRGAYGSDPEASVVMMGSSNWSDGSLSGADENTLTIARAKAYQQYLRNWGVVSRHSKRIG